MPVDRSAAERWVQAYRRAWLSNDAEDVAVLFTENARYVTLPWDPPIEGREAIVAWWLGPRHDEPGSWTFEHEILAVDGDLAIVRGTTVYAPSPSDAAGQVYANIWLIRLDEDGRARQFEEWWIQRP